MKNSLKPYKRLLKNLKKKVIEVKVKIMMEKIINKLNLEIYLIK